MSTDYETDPGWQYLRRNREQIIEVLKPKTTIFEDQSAPYDSKKDCWIPDKEEGYIAAQILSTKGDQVVVSAKGIEASFSSISE
ncbi:unnamed protein product [Toxocara canis]|uniref:Myosin N-terminal SH3-like domain-containing protein n=1 Tax=Toxocara canis TaxID=6265 RepID=A0A183TYJ2_TOXCA|nr:unnamed protein product [Toxocara canis]